MKALIIYSGGMDSTVLLHQYKKNIKLAVNFGYGSNHNDREFEMARLNCHELGIELLYLDLRDVFKHFDSALLNGAQSIPEGHYEDENMKQTVVPFRNGIMLSIAAGIAESKKLDTILIGNHSGDHEIYPDCRETFIQMMDYAIGEGTWNDVEIESPFQNNDKRDIAIIGKSLGVDFTKTYTCYKGQEKHCGVCGSCTERKEALEGFDNTEYEN